MAPRAHRMAGVVVALAALALAACETSSSTTTADAVSSTGASGADDLSVGDDPTDLIREAAFNAWEDLPLAAQSVRPPLVGGEREYLGVAVVLPGSEPRRLLLAVWRNACVPVVTVSAPDPGSTAKLLVAFGQHPGEQCGEVLRMWPFEVILNRDLDPAAVVLEVRDRRPY